MAKYPFDRADAERTVAHNKEAVIGAAQALVHRWNGNFTRRVALGHLLRCVLEMEKSQDDLRLANYIKAVSKGGE